MSVGIRSTSPSFRWPDLIAGNGEWCPCPWRKTPRERKPWNRLVSPLLKQGKRKYPLPLHPIPPSGCKERKTCQACARSKMSGMSPAVQTEVVGDAEVNDGRGSDGVLLEGNDDEGTGAQGRIGVGGVAVYGCDLSVDDVFSG